jgi:uncharacterized protein YbcI
MRFRRYNPDIGSDIATSPKEVRSDPVRASDGRTLGTLSRRLVQLLHQRAGRGPTQAKSYWAGDDILLVVLGDGFTDIERTLSERGHGRLALDYRSAIQEALEAEMRAEVEKLTMRRVVAAMSSLHKDPDLIVEVFMLEGLDGRGAREPTIGGAADQAAPLPGQGASLDGSG